MRNALKRTSTAGLLCIGLALAFLTAPSAQTTQLVKLPDGANYGVDPSYKAPRTADGQPDLQGVWANNSVTPMTRPKQWKDKTVITDQELTELKEIVAKQADSSGGDAIFQNQVQLALDAKEKGKFDQTSYDPTTGNYNQFWMADRDWDTRTSLIIDPPNGEFPPMTPDGEARRKNNPLRRTGRPRGPEDLPLSERCLSYGAPRTGAGYNSYVQIIQSKDVVVLQQEMIHDARVVPVIAKPHLPASVRQLHGDPRGHWEGDSLVVETTNYTNGFMGSTPDVRLTERYTRVGKDYINWIITVDDAKTWTQPWSFMIRLKRSEEPIFEYACHEGNYAMTGILGGARREEAEEAKAGKKK
jgi:hypothetical protein